jgi:hypothetical protein
VARLSDQVEAKIARANRAFRLSSRIIDSTRGDLKSHGAWLDRHAAWTAEVKRHHRLLRRKLNKLALRRFVVGLLFAAPFALVRAIEAKLKNIATPKAPQSRPFEPAPDFAPRDPVPRRIGLVEAEHAAHAATERSPVRRIAVSPAGAVIILVLGLAAAGAAHAVLSAPPAVMPASAAPKALAPTTLEAAALVIQQQSPSADAALIMPAEIEPSDSLSGFAILPAACSPDTLWLPPQTVADMLSMTRSLVFEPTPAETVPAAMAADALPPAQAPPAQANKAKRKRTLVAREPESLPWWQDWSWIGLR